MPSQKSKRSVSRKPKLKNNFCNGKKDTKKKRKKIVIS